MVVVSLGGRLVGDGHPCLIVLEPGATHTGLESAKGLIKAAAEGGADAVKFQTVNTEKLMATRDLEIEYGTSRGIKKESVYQALRRRELTPAEWHDLKRYCDDLGLLRPHRTRTPEDICRAGVSNCTVTALRPNDRRIARDTDGPAKSVAHSSVVRSDFRLLRPCRTRPREEIRRAP